MSIHQTKKKKNLRKKEKKEREKNVKSILFLKNKELLNGPSKSYS